jgi:hypothetical protein
MILYPNKSKEHATVLDYFLSSFLLNAEVSKLIKLKLLPQMQ